MASSSSHSSGAQIRAELVPTLSMLLSIAAVVSVAPHLPLHLLETQRIVVLFAVAILTYVAARAAVDGLASRLPNWRRPEPAE
jgi:hypothetical protein